MSRQKLELTLNEMDLENSPKEQEYRRKMIGLLRSTPDCFYRTSFPAHFTGSALVVSADGEKALLTHHKFLNKWLQFGGHCDGEENILLAAQREALEESGIEGLVPASEKPFDIDIHAIPENPKKGEPPHFHYDVRYIFISPGNAAYTVSEESHDLRWFTPDEMLSMGIDDSLSRLVQKWKDLLKLRKSNL